MRTLHLFKLIIFSAMLTFVMAGMAGAVNVTLEASSDTVSIGGTVDLMVKVDDARLDDGTSLAGAAFTIEYDPSKVIVAKTDGSEIQGEFGAGDNFSDADAFNKSFSSADGDSIFPIVGNNVPAENKVKMSGAYIATTGDYAGEGAYDGPQTLFTIRFKTKDAAVQDGETLNFTLMKTNLTNAAANWNGEDVPPLVGVNPDGDLTPDDFNDDFPDMDAVLPTESTIVTVMQGPAPGSGNPNQDTYADGSPKVDIFDLVIAVQNFGPTNGDPVAEACDVKDDSTVDIFDLVEIVKLF